MDKKKTLIIKVLLLTAVAMLTTFYAYADRPRIEKIKLIDKHIEYKAGNDTVTIFFKLYDEYNKPQDLFTPEELMENITILENGEEISDEKLEFRVADNIKIPAEYTFSVLVDLSIPEKGMNMIKESIHQLVKQAADSSVFISFFGNEVTSTEVITKHNLSDFDEMFNDRSDRKMLYSALCAKLLEYEQRSHELETRVVVEDDYRKNPAIAERAIKNPDKNILFVFIEGMNAPDYDDEISSFNIRDYQVESVDQIIPRINAFYYTEQGSDPYIEDMLVFLCKPKRNGEYIEGLQGEYFEADRMNSVTQRFESQIQETKPDYMFSYVAADDATYTGRVLYSAKWGKRELGEAQAVSIGTAERPWPVRKEAALASVLKYILAAIIALLGCILFFVLQKVLVPWVRSKSFAMKYYKPYVPEANVSRRICHFCKQEIQPGHMVVMKCKHIMHVGCWQQNGFKCAEYGQNCKTGIQPHVDWKCLLTASSFKDSMQIFSGITAGLICWVLYELVFSRIFTAPAAWLTDLVYGSTGILRTECIATSAAFIAMGLLLGFFLSIIFRANDEYRKKDFMIWMKVIGLSLLTGIIGMIAFAIGAVLFCLLVSLLHTAYIPWYCSLPAYMLFSISVSLALAIASTIPVKSALLGGLCSSVIGFFVLYFSRWMTMSNAWVSMLLNFIIYGGGLGASLITVRILAEKYFLEIQNGVRAGQRIPIHKWMNANGGGNKVTIGMTGECEIQMNWEKSNKVAKQHVQLFIDYDKHLPVLKPLSPGVIFNTRAELPVGVHNILSNGDTFQIGDTTFIYTETE